jgi:hypothetical protein
MSAMCKDQHEILLKWCNVCAESGGSFAVKTEYSGNWYQTYVINWPSREIADAQTVRAAAAISSGRTE